MMSKDEIIYCKTWKYQKCPFSSLKTLLEYCCISCPNLEECESVGVLCSQYEIDPDNCPHRITEKEILIEYL